MKYAYEDLSDLQFEHLIVLLCQRLLGISVMGFAEGPDGGRDAKFVGTAEIYPSKAKPWSGTTIIQAKHTNGYNRSFSESDFYSQTSTNTVVGEETPRINNLRVTKPLDHYMLFANRRLSANAESSIRAHISKEGSIPEESICLCGVEQLELWWKTFADVPKLANLDPVDSPLIVSPDDLAVVVEALASQKHMLSEVPDAPPTKRVHYEQKDALNNMSEQYARTQVRRYLKDTSLIKAFLAAPENQELLRMYESVVEEFEFKIIAKRKNYQEFDAVMEHLIDLLFNRDPVLRRHKRLTRIMVFYMYWNCDIGQVLHAEAN